MHKLRELFAAARASIAEGREPPRLFMAQDWTPGPTYGRDRPQTFAERRAAYASVIERVRRGIEGEAYRRRRSLIIAETPACQTIIADLRMMDNLPWGVSLADAKAPLEAKLEAIISAHMAVEMECAA